MCLRGLGLKKTASHCKIVRGFKGGGGEKTKGLVVNEVRQ